MSQINSKSRINRLCLISFILLCSVLTCENAFSRGWVHKDMSAEKINNNTIQISFLLYDCTLTPPLKHSYLERFEIEYTEDARIFVPLVKGQTDKQEDMSKLLRYVNITYRKKGENIEFKNGMYITDPNKIWVKYLKGSYKNGTVKKESMYSKVYILWTVPKSIKSVKVIKIKGVWTKDNEYSEIQNIHDNYPVNFDRFNSNKLKDTPSSESENVKITGSTDAINVTGVKHGDNIKVYNSNGIEVKSVVAKDDVVNIKLQKNQNYLIKVGEFSQKVSL